MFAKKFLTGSILSLSLIFGLQNVACADKIKVKVRDNYDEMILELNEDDYTIFSQSIPGYCSYKYNVAQLNGMEIEDEPAIDDIHEAIRRSVEATEIYYESMESGSDLCGDDTLTGATRIYENYIGGLKNLIMSLNSASK